MDRQWKRRHWRALWLLSAIGFLLGLVAQQLTAQTTVNGRRHYKGAVTSNSTYNYCADAGSTDAYACSLSPAITAYATGACYTFKANTANTGAATINFNSVGAVDIKKAVGGVTTALSDNDIRAGQIVTVCKDPTNMQMQSVLGNGGGGGGSVTLDTYANLPGSLDGTYACTNCPYTWFGTGGTPSAYAFGQPVTIPPSTGWTSDNVTGALDSTRGSVFLTFAGGSVDLSGRYRTMCSAPCKMRVLVGWSSVYGDKQGIAWGVRESATGKIKVTILSNSAGFLSGHWTNATTWSANTQSYASDASGPLWLEVEDDNTNIVWRIGWDGQNFFTIRTEARTTFATCDQFFIGLYSNTSLTLGMTMFSYSEH